MFRLILLLLYANECFGYGYDNGGDQGACGRQYRSGRVYRPPCDLTEDGYCTKAGSAYPWHAVQRFVRENQGLMRRMYGDQTHGQVLRGELDEEQIQSINRDQQQDRKRYAKQEFDFNAENELFEARFLRDEDISNDDVLNTKFVYSEEPSISIKLGDLRTAPHFRPTSPKSILTDTLAKTTSETVEPITSTETEPPTTTPEITTTEPTTNDNYKNAEINENILAQSSTSSSAPLGGDKPSAVLFQDAETDRNKVQVNNQMKGVNACPVKEEVVAPFWANNTRGEVLALLNVYPFEQYVHWEKCTHEHRQMYCRDGCRCEQQYRLHRLLAYDPNNECRGIFSDWFRFPSCCVCKCYNIPPAEFRVTSRSPRANEQFHGVPDWYRRKNEAIFAAADHG